MTTKTTLGGVICAIVTPIRDGQPDIANLQTHMRALEADGCDGVLLLGTTGEGTSMGMAQRETVVRGGMEARGNLTILVGTGTPSVQDTITLTQQAFELGADGVVTLPPFYYNKVTHEGITAFYRAVLDEAVPDGKMLLAYHIPQVSGMPVSFEVLEALQKHAPGRFVGIKDSTGDWEHTQALNTTFPDLRVFAGNDHHLYNNLKAGGAGCITAACNLFASLASEVYRTFQDGGDAQPAQDRLSAARSVLDRFPPSSASLKSVLALRYNTAGWDLCPPLMAVSDSVRDGLLKALAELDLSEQLPWLKEVIASAEVVM